MKLVKMSIDVQDSNDINIKLSLEHMVSLPWVQRTCIQKSGDRYPYNYKITVWFVHRPDWTPEMEMVFDKIHSEHEQGGSS